MGTISVSILQNSRCSISSFPLAMDSLTPKGRSNTLLWKAAFLKQPQCSTQWAHLLFLNWREKSLSLWLIYLSLTLYANRWWVTFYVSDPLCQQVWFSLDLAAPHNTSWHLSLLQFVTRKVPYNTSQPHKDGLLRRPNHLATQSHSDEHIYLDK